MRSTGFLFNAPSFLQCFDAVGLVMAGKVTGQLADTPTRGLDISRTVQLTDWTTRGLADAAKRTKTKHAKLPVASASCPVRDLSSTRVV